MTKHESFGAHSQPSTSSESPNSETLNIDVKNPNISGEVASTPETITSNLKDEGPKQNNIYNAENQPKNTTEASIDGKSESSESLGTGNLKEGEQEPLRVNDLHLEIQDILKAEKLEDPEARVDPTKQIEFLNSTVNELDERISQLESSINKRRDGLREAREALGIHQTGPETLSDEETELKALKAEKAEAERYQKEAEEVADMQEAMDEMNKLPRDVVNFIIIHGHMPSGEPFRTKKGKELKPDIAKNIANAVGNGVKFVTKLIVQTTFAILKGVVKGVGAGVKAALS